MTRCPIADSHSALPSESLQNLSPPTQPVQQPRGCDSAPDISRPHDPTLTRLGELIQAFPRDRGGLAELIQLPVNSCQKSRQWPTRHRRPAVLVVTAEQTVARIILGPKGQDSHSAGGHPSRCGRCTIQWRRGLYALERCGQCTECDRGWHQWWRWTAAAIPRAPYLVAAEL